MDIKELKLSEIDFNLDEPVAFDTETIGLYGKIRLAQFYQKGWDAVVLVHYPDPIELAVAIKDLTCVMHNAHYDITCLQTDVPFVPENFEDTFLLARLHFYTEDKFSLDAVMEYVLGYDPYADAGIDKKLMQKINWDIPVLTSTQKLYAALDVYHLIEVYDTIKCKRDTTSYKLDIHTLRYCLDFQNNGMPVLEDELNKQYAANVGKIEDYNLPINVNSWQQTRPYIEHDESDALALATLTIQGNEKAKAVQVVRKLIKQNNFLNKFQSDLGRVFGKFLPSARSGRLTSKDQNMQQLPRLLKHIFGYDTNEGKVLVYGDYPQLEMRSICVIVGELILETLFREGGDTHSYVAKMLFGEEFTKTQRQIAKTCNFNLLYGGGAGMLVSILIKDAMLLISENDASGYKRQWLKLYPAIAKYITEGIKAHRAGIAWATPFGRPYVGKLMTDQLNIKNQGFGAEVAKLALHYLMPELKLIKSAKLLNFIHDSYIIECDSDPEVYEQVSAVLAMAMQKAWFEALRVGVDLKMRDLPMPIEIFVGYNWGLIEEDYLYKYELEGMKYYETV